MPAMVALLRGVNVGGRARVGMAELRDIASGIGLAGARTYLQSGNLLFEAPTAGAGDVGRDLERAIAGAFGLKIAVLIRTRDELAVVAASNPYVDVEPDPTRLHAVFLAGAPPDELVAGLEADRFLPDAFDVRGPVVYVHYPGGAGRSKLTIDYFERRLGTAATARNWNTVTKLLAMLDA